MSPLAIVLLGLVAMGVIATGLMVGCWAVAALVTVRVLEEEIEARRPDQSEAR